MLTRLNESANQANRALLNMPARYNTRMLAADIKNYFESNNKALEVLIFRRRHELSVYRRFALSARFYTVTFKWSRVDEGLLLSAFSAPKASHVYRIARTYI